MMVDGVDGGGAGGGGGGAGQQGGGQGGGNPVVAAHEWMGALPESLRADPTLSRYNDVTALAQGHLEARRLASSRLAIPGDNGTPEQWNAVFDGLGRPADPMKYEIPVPEGQGTELAEAFRPVAHQIGLLPQQTKPIAEFFNAQMKAAQDAHYAKGEAEITSLKQELGPQFEGKRAAAAKAVEALGLPAEFLDELETKVGSAALLKGMMSIADKIGEPGRVDGDSDPLLGIPDAQAEARIGELQKSAEWRAKLTSGDPTVKAEYERLLNAAKRHAVRGG